MSTCTCSEAVCTPYATSMLADYFEEVGSLYDCVIRSCDIILVVPMVGPEGRGTGRVQLGDIHWLQCDLPL